MHEEKQRGVLNGAEGDLLTVGPGPGERVQLVRLGRGLYQLADASIAYFDARWKHGEPPEFAALFFRGLLTLADTDGRADYVAAAEQYADDAWSRERDPRTGLFRYAGKPTLLQQAGLVQLYAALAARGVTVAH